MARLYLIRHGEPVGSWGVSHDPDPGLTTLGLEQARAAAAQLVAHAPRRIVTSPLRRARETSAPLAASLGLDAVVAQEVAEIPTPATVSMADRGTWLRSVMAGTWSVAGDDLSRWRGRVTDYLAGIGEDTAVFSHYVAINAAIGAAIGDDRVLCFSPAHASVTIIETNGRSLSLVELGAVAETVVR